MPEWAGWALAIAVAILYFRSWAHDPAPIRIELLAEIERLNREWGEVWWRCGHLEGFVDDMAAKIIKKDPAPDFYARVTNAARRWRAWRAEQLAQKCFCENAPDPPRR